MKAGTFHLHFNRLEAARNDAEAWTVWTRLGNRYARRVECHVPLTTVYRGNSARQPRAYLRGYGTVSTYGDTIVIRGV